MLTATKDGVTLASTTASQEQLDAALGLSPETKETKTLETPAAEPVKVAETVSELEPDNTQETEEEKQKRKGGWQRKIDKLTKHNADLQATLEEERLARQRLEARLTGNPVVPEPKPDAGEADAEPKPEQFTTYEQWVKAQAKWEVRQEIKAETAKSVQQKETEKLQNNFNKHLERVKAAEAKYPDWPEVAESMSTEDGLIPESVAALIVELENGPDVIYHLAKHQELRKELNAMSPVRAAARVGALAETLTVKSGESVSQSSETPEPKTRSAAPAPIKPVSGSTAKSTVDPSKLPLSEYVRLRNAGQLR